MLIGGVKDVLLEQGQTGGGEGSWGGRRCTFWHRGSSAANKLNRQASCHQRGSKLL